MVLCLLYYVQKKHIIQFAVRQSSKHVDSLALIISCAKAAHDRDLHSLRSAVLLYHILYNLKRECKIYTPFLVLMGYCSLVPRSSNGFCRCFAFQIGKICCHHCIIRHFQFRKCLPVNSNTYGIICCYAIRLTLAA